MTARPGERVQAFKHVGDRQLGDLWDELALQKRINVGLADRCVGLLELLGRASSKCDDLRRENAALVERLNQQAASVRCWRGERYVGQKCEGLNGRLVCLF